MENKREPFKMVIEEVYPIPSLNLTIVAGKIPNNENIGSYSNVELHGKKGIVSNIVAIREHLCRRNVDFDLIDFDIISFGLKDISKDDVEVGDIIIEKID